MLLRNCRTGILPVMLDRLEAYPTPNARATWDRLEAYPTPFAPFLSSIGLEACPIVQSLLFSWITSSTQVQ